ncbi:MAG TPA: hypothetical protein DEA47_05020 [Peptococcaceae bacterium]|nr:MAG: hypothetical protein XD50_1102 [Clostridia bacterium 41_269]HBT20704.1 hypothetical protein [Peptococcaceae bacterium]
MTFEEVLLKYKQCFRNQGTFDLKKEEKISSRVREAKVPNKPGVYLIYALKKTNCELIYIGRAGTMLRDGSFKKQGLFERLKAKQKGISRNKYFQEQMKKLGIETLIFEWFVTFDEYTKVIPAKAEAELLQAYFENYNVLPLWNNCI